MIEIHYALQTCDVKSHQGQKRYASDDRTEISKKCIQSFLESIKYCSEQKETKHYIAIIDDHSTVELKTFIRNCLTIFSSNSIHIEFIELDSETGIRKSIEQCYLWLQKNGKDLVYQVQDDYLFTKEAINDIVDIFKQIEIETKHHAVISPWNDSWLWLSSYRNRTTPRTVLVGKRSYWIQYYDMSCSFLTSHQQFSQHWDLYYRFFDLIDKRTENNNDLENKSLNYMLTQRGILGLVPVNSVAFHLQSDLEKDPHIDYRPLWDSINVT
jgi:hypothetical protein